MSGYVGGGGGGLGVPPGWLDPGLAVDRGEGQDNGTARSTRGKPVSRAAMAERLGAKATKIAAILLYSACQGQNKDKASGLHARH